MDNKIKEVERSSLKVGKSVNERIKELKKDKTSGEFLEELLDMYESMALKNNSEEKEKEQTKTNVAESSKKKQPGEIIVQCEFPKEGMELLREILNQLKENGKAIKKLKIPIPEKDLPPYVKAIKQIQKERNIPTTDLGILLTLTLDELEEVLDGTMILDYDWLNMFCNRLNIYTSELMEGRITLLPPEERGAMSVYAYGK